MGSGVGVWVAAGSVGLVGVSGGRAPVGVRVGMSSGVGSGGAGVSAERGAVSAVAVCEPAHRFAIVNISAGLLPQLYRLKGGHKDFLGAGFVHFLADDLDDLEQASPAEGQICVSTAGDFSYQTSPNHKFMANCLGVGRNFFYRWYKHPAVFHISYLVLPVSFPRKRESILFSFPGFLPVESLKAVRLSQE